MLLAYPINSDASLNSFRTIEDQEFVPGENRTLCWQLWNSESDMRYVLPSTAVITMTFYNVNGTSFTKTASFIDAGDRSLISVALLPADTTNLVSGNIQFSVDVLGNGTNIMMGVVYNGLRRLDTTAG